MLRYEILYLVGSQQLQEKTAAELLDTTVSAVKATVTRLGPRVHLLPQALGPLRLQAGTLEERTQQVKQAAEMLQVTRRQVRRFLESSKVKLLSPLKQEIRQKQKEISKNKWKTRQKAAISVISGAEDVESASTWAECSPRQLYRWVNHLLEPEGITIKDLREVRLASRQSLARKLENAEERSAAHA